MSERSKVIQVTMLDVLRGDFEEWLNDRGLGLQVMPEMGGESGMEQYVVIIPAGSPLERHLRGDGDDA